MDIGKWLGETADRAPPESPNGHQLPGLVQSQFIDIEQLPDHDGRKRKRPSSDSSLILARKTSRHAACWSPSRRTRERLDERDDASSHNSISSSSVCRDSRERHYERRPRRKTRSDRYELKSKGTRQRRRKTEEGGGGRRKGRRSYRSGDGDRTYGLVQSFQLKNSSRKDRLTLRPDHYVGLFKHGRAGPQMSGRGNGLPDLAFNEMRFLQRPTEHQDEPYAAQVTPQRPNGGQKIQNGEIPVFSEYANAAHDGNPNKRTVQLNTTEPIPIAEDRRKQDGAAALAGLPEKAFLGSGSTGAHFKQVQDSATECVAWPDSLPGRQSPVLQRQRVSSAKRLESKTHRKVAQDVFAQVDKPDLACKLPQSRIDELETETGTQNLPRLPGRRGRQDDQQSQKGRINTVPRAYRTSDILEVELLEPAPSSARGTTSERPDCDFWNDKENADPHASMDELLIQTRKALDGRWPTRLSPSRWDRKPQETWSNARREMPQSSSRDEIRAPVLERPVYSNSHVRLTSVYPVAPRVHQNAKHTRFLPLHHRAEPSTFDDATLPFFARDVQHEAIGSGPIHFADDGMLNTDVVLGTEYSAVEGEYDLDCEMVEIVEGLTGVSNAPFSAGSLGRRMSIHGLPAEQQPQYAESGALATDQEDEFTGFWKPNKLY